MKKKIKIRIIRWLTGTVLFEYESAGNTFKKTVEKAVSGGANLRGADLRGADLRGANKNAKWYWHIHHEKLLELLIEPLKNRIKYIKEVKSKEEKPKKIKLRLKLLKRVKGKLPKKWADVEKLHKKECGCAWDGKTIFTKGNGIEDDN